MKNLTDADDWRTVRALSDQDDLTEPNLTPPMQDLADRTLYLKNRLTAALPAGTVIAYAGLMSSPDGFIQCSGICVAVTLFPALAAAIYVGDTYNSNINATFGYRSDDSLGISRDPGGAYIKLPDLRGEFIRGLDDNRGVDPGRLGCSLQHDMFASHAHPPASDSGFLNWPAAGATGIEQNQSGGPSDWSDSTTLTGYAGGLETRPRNIAMRYYIKF
jgi:hypothetical protein